MNTKEIEIAIEDPMGAYSGIQIYGEHVDLKPEMDRILITGRMRSTSEKLAAALHLEPEITADILNPLDEVVLSSAGTHIGAFWATRSAPFELEMERVSERVPWKEIKTIKIRVCFMEK